MTIDEHDDDAEFEAFLNGEGELARALQALPQPAPSPEQDAAILRRARFSMTQEERPVAANDAPPPTSKLRWRVPLGLAATVLVGVVAQQAWQASGGDRFENADTSERPTMTAAPVPPPPPPPSKAMAPTEMPAPPRLMEARPSDTVERNNTVVKGGADVSESRQRQAPNLIPESQIVAQGVPLPEPKAAARAPAAIDAAPMLRFSEEVPPPPMPAVVATPAPAASLRATAPPPALPAPSMAKPVAGASAHFTLHGQAQPPVAAQWVDLIEQLLRDGYKREALDEWAKFRQAYPDYPVTPALTERIKAAQQ